MENKLEEQLEKQRERQGTSVVLLYHRMGWPKLGSLVTGQYVAPCLFRSQMDSLVAGGWKPVSFADMIENGERDEDKFCITFDDGYLSVYDRACPVLAERGMTGTIFVVADSVGGINEWDRRRGDQAEKMMSAHQLAELAESGLEIASHTLTHPRLPQLSDGELKRELVDSKRKLEDISGHEVTSFSYPYGDYDERVRDAAQESGYKYAATTRLGVVPVGVQPYEIPRVNVRWNAITPLLMRKIRRARRASGMLA